MDYLLHTRIARLCGGGWLIVERRVVLLDGERDLFFEVVGDGTLCRPGPGAILYHSSHVGVGPLLFAGLPKAGVSDVCHFGREKRERGQNQTPGTIFLMPPTLTVREKPILARMAWSVQRAAAFGVCLGLCNTGGTGFGRWILSPSWPVLPPRTWEHLHLLTFTGRTLVPDLRVSAKRSTKRKRMEPTRPFGFLLTPGACQNGASRIRFRVHF